MPLYSSSNALWVCINSHAYPHHWKIKMLMFSLQFTPKLLSIFNALFTPSRFQERAKSAGNLLSLLWPQQAKQKALSGVLAPGLQQREGSSSSPWVGTSAVPWKNPSPGHCSGVKPSPGTPGARGAAVGQDQQCGLGTWWTWFYDPIQKGAEQGCILKNLNFHLQLQNLSCGSWFT